MTKADKLHPNIHAALSELRAGYKIYDHREFSVEIKAPDDFAAALGYPIQRIAKTLFLCSKDRPTYAAVVCSIDRRLDFKVIADVLGVSHVAIASAEELLAKTGYPKNGVSPLGLTRDIAVVVDHSLLGYPTVLIGGGAAAIEIELSPSDVVSISRAVVKGITA